jgi:hypothetical protein
MESISNRLHPPRLEGAIFFTPNSSSIEGEAKRTVSGSVINNLKDTDSSSSALIDVDSTIVTNY